MLFVRPRRFVSALRSRTLIVLLVVVALAGALAAGAAAFDQANRDRIAGGVKIAGIDVGGLTAEQARTRLQRRLVDPLRRPVVVRHGEQSFRLTPQQAKVVVRVDAAVNEAVERSREGGLISRVVRRITGRGVDATLEPRITYSKRAVSDLVRRVQSAVDAEPVDATVEFSLAGPKTIPGHDGRKVKVDELRSAVRKALTSPDADRTIRARVRTVKAKVTEEDLPSRYPTAIVVNRSAFRLDLYKNLKKVKSYDIGIGSVGRETPAGLFHIQNKAVNPAWIKPHSDWIPEEERGQVVPGGVPENPLKARWLGIYDGAGIHGIDPSQYGTIGTAASHGCIRMRIPDVIDLYDRVDVGTPIYIGG